MSELTVPRAGLDAGRSATVRVEANSAAADVAQFGQTMANVGMQLEGDRLEREMNRLSIDLTKDMNDLRLDLAQIGDPDQLEAVFKSRVKDLKSSYIDGQNDLGRPRVDPRNKEKFGLAFDDLAVRQQFAVGSQALAGRFAQREATYIEYAHTAASTAATADQDTRDVMFDQGSAQIDQLEANGIIDPATAAQRRLSLRASMDEAAALSLLNEDPQQFLDADADGDFSGLSGDSRSRFIASANNKILSAQAKAEKDLEIAVKAEEKAVSDRLGEMSGIWSAGQRAVDEDAYLSRPDVQAHPDFPKAMAQKQLLDEQPALDMMTVGQLDQLVDAEKNRPKAFKFQAERLEVLEGKLASEKEAWAKDPIAQARQKGFGAPEVPQFDPENPDAFAQGLNQIRNYSSSLVENGWTDHDAVFSQDDITNLKEQIAGQDDPAQLAVMAKAIVGSLGSRPDVIGLVSNDPVFQYVGSLQLSNGSPKLAAEILTGQQAVAQKTVILPPLKDRLEPTFESVETLFLDIPGGPKLQANVMASADALYGARMGRVDPADDIDEDVYGQALHEVLGGTGAFDGRNARGGVQDVFDTKTMLPMGINAKQVENALDGLTKQLVDDGLGGPNKITKTGHDILSSGLSRIAVRADETGAFVSSDDVPLINGQDVFLQSFDRLKIRAVANGVFEFFYTDQRGRVLVPETQSGEPYRFSMSALMKGAAK
ncbi:hypothetical protein [Pacificibacter marinus]|uniref:hypothetical protein n=1 Tax=Pacificibacter marinus TaxID=658057 RepID=UPI001C0685BD|nr:hypothetical protein [Pacificibacter marinus]MBU2867012.1 hypothetical protein [Pacificibacter marinus]